MGKQTVYIGANFGMKEIGTVCYCINLETECKVREKFVTTPTK